ncbi:PH domain-containing protein [Sphingomicrobium nitratireducens]|uniref:PH domain-containing protein n=1 Tax=Sphingomicrobium nitratireducens TaxID=2964666 RepID=UPI00223EF280|nr:PH domain-containing protein [Sphingomicrobium nitratireducens]
MSDTDFSTLDHKLSEAIDPARPLLPPGMEPAEPAYRWLLTTQLLLTWLPFLVGALVIDNVVLADKPVQGVLSTIVGVLMIAIVLFVPLRIYRRLGFKLDPHLLRVVRGWLFHTDTMVPFVRVQHLDVARRPLDKVFGTASLVVHTAGTHNSIVTLPGLSPERAAAMRDEIRAEIRTDWQ